jgi:tetratricopeptide (TPR) repeat protein
MHLALGAMERDRDDEALGYLKRALVLAPDSGLLHHLLGAMYAELKMIDRAIQEMTLAITYGPHLKMARFQLGLLHFTSGDLPSAEEVWGPLAELPEGDPLRLFRSGLVALARDDFAASIADMRQGLEANDEHPSLNHDIEQLVGLAEQALAEQTAAETPSPAATNGSGAVAGQHVLLSGYQGTRGDEK